jgi:hypothetical protein
MPLRTGLFVRNHCTAHAPLVPVVCLAHLLGRHDSLHKRLQSTTYHVLSTGYLSLDISIITSIIIPEKSFEEFHEEQPPLADRPPAKCAMTCPYISLSLSNCYLTYLLGSDNSRVLL